MYHHSRFVRCDPQFKKQCKAFHIKCNKSKKCAMVSGSLLNFFLEENGYLEEKMAEDDFFPICRTISSRVNDHECNMLKKRRERKRSLCVLNAFKIQRKSKRQNPNLMIEDNSFKTVKIIFSGHENIHYFGDDESDINKRIKTKKKSGRTTSENNNSIISTQKKKKRRTKYQKIIDDVLDDSAQFHFSFSKISVKERSRRTRKLATLIIAACIDKSKLRKGKEIYLKHNMVLSGDIQMLMDATKDEIQKIILVNLSAEESQLVPTVPTTPPLDISID